jgi:hypothetical protein
MQPVDCGRYYDWLAGSPEEYMHLTNSFFYSASFSFLGEVGEKKRK